MASTTEWNPQQAEAKAKEFEAKLRPTMTVAELARLWKDYYLLTGHKRLARALLKLAKTDGEQPGSPTETAEA